MEETSFTKEYIIDKNYIYNNTFEELKELLKEHDKIKIITYPKYVPIAFQVAKELYTEGLSTFDESLKVERDFKDSKRKTRIYITIKRKPKIFEYLIGKDYFYKNIFDEVMSYLNTHDKVTLVAKHGEVGIAFKVANELVKKKIAYYDEELKLGQNFKEGQGKTKVYISLKKRPGIKNKTNEEKTNKDSNIEIIKPKDKDINEIKINEKNEETKELLVEKNITCDKLINSIKDKIKENHKIKLVADKNNVGLAFTAVEALVKKKEIMYDEELNVKKEIKNGKGRAKVYISIKKKN